MHRPVYTFFADNNAWLDIAALVFVVAHRSRPPPPPVCCREDISGVSRPYLEHSREGIERIERLHILDRYCMAPVSTGDGMADLRLPENGQVSSTQYGAPSTRGIHNSRVICKQQPSPIHRVCHQHRVASRRSKVQLSALSVRRRGPPMCISLIF